MFAALRCLLFSSSFLSSFVSGSPVETQGPVLGRRVALNGYTIGPIQWRGHLEKGKPLVYLSGNSFKVCFQDYHVTRSI